MSSRRRFTPEQIIGKLREGEVTLAQGQTTAQVCRNLGFAEQTFYRWRGGEIPTRYSTRLFAM